MHEPLLELPLVDLDINDSLNTGNPLINNDGDDNLNVERSFTSGSNESFDDAVDDALNANVEAQTPLANLNGVENGEQLENVRRVGRTEWDELIRLAAEVNTNSKGKRLALCWQCKGWFEAIQGMKVHKRACSLPMPLLFTLSMEGDSAVNNNLASEEEVGTVRKLEQAYFAQRPIYSDISSFSDPDTSMIDLDLEDLDSVWSDKNELNDSHDELDWSSKNKVPSPGQFGLNEDASPVFLGGEECNGQR
jgi:hypothetical protein